MLESHLENQNNKNEDSSSLPMIEESLELSWDTYYEEDRTKAEQYVQENPGRIRIVKSSDHNEVNNYFTILFYVLNLSTDTSSEPKGVIHKLKIQRNEVDKSISFVNSTNIKNIKYSIANQDLSDILKAIGLDISKLIFEKKTVIQSITNYIHRMASKHFLSINVGLFKKDALAYTESLFWDLEWSYEAKTSDENGFKLLYIAPVQNNKTKAKEFFLAEYAHYDIYGTNVLFKNITSLVLDFPNLSHAQRELVLNNIFRYCQNYFESKTEQTAIADQNNNMLTFQKVNTDLLASKFVTWYRPQWEASQKKINGMPPLPVCLFIGVESLTSAILSLDNQDFLCKAQKNILCYFILSTQPDLDKKNETFIKVQVCSYLNGFESIPLKYRTIIVEDVFSKVLDLDNIIDSILELIKADVHSRIEKFNSMKISSLDYKYVKEWQAQRNKEISAQPEAPQNPGVQKADDYNDSFQNDNNDPKQSEENKQPKKKVTMLSTMLSFFNLLSGKKKTNKDGYDQPNNGNSPPTMKK